MASIIDRLNHELETFGRKAQAALDEGKLQIELMRVRRQREGAARELGNLIYRRERGTTVDQLQVDALLVRMDNLGSEIERLEKAIVALKTTAVTVHEQPAPAATTAESEVVGE
jgi:hypothetical protein